MRAFMVSDFGAEGVIGERPIPEPGEGEVRVSIDAAGVNAVDVPMVAGYLKDFIETRLPLVPGLDLAGTIDAIGPGAADFAVGDDVFGSLSKPYFGDGTFAEYAVASTGQLRHRPAGVDAVTAAALPLSGGTALGLVTAAQLEPGQVVLIMGAGGGLGSYAIALAVHAGARVIAATRGGAGGPGPHPGRFGGDRLHVGRCRGCGSNEPSRRDRRDHRQLERRRGAPSVG